MNYFSRTADARHHHRGGVVWPHPPQHCQQPLPGHLCLILPWGTGLHCRQVGRAVAGSRGPGSVDQLLSSRLQLQQVLLQVDRSVITRCA